VVAAVLLVVGLALLAGVAAVRLWEQRRFDGRREVLRLHFPSELAPEAVVGFVRTLSALPVGGPVGPFSAVVFEVVARTGATEHRLRIHQPVAANVRRYLAVAIPGLVMEEINEANVARPVAVTELGLRQRRRPLRIDQPAGVASALLAALAAVEAGEQLILQLVVAPERTGRVELPSVPTKTSGPADIGRILGTLQTADVTAKDLRDKHAEPLFGVALRIGAVGRPERARVLVRYVRGVLAMVERPGVHFHQLPWSAAMTSERITRASTPVFERPLTLNAREVAQVTAWPIGSPVVPGLVRSLSRQLPAVPEIPAHGRLLGTSALPGSNRVLAISTADSLHHAHILGPTGVGKSTLLARLAIGDLAAGRGLVVIDPKGDLVASTLDRVPPDRREDVIVLDPTDDTRPVGLNLLAGGPGSAERTADEVVGLFHRLFATSWGPRTADVLHSCLLTLTAMPGMTLCELPALLVDDAFRDHLVGQVSDRVLLGFWAWYEQLSPGERAQAIGPVMNKLRAFLLRRRVRTILGQAEPSWSFEDVLNRRKVLLVNLAKGELGGEAAALIGSLVVAQLWRSVQRRAVRLPVMVTIDEFQDVLNLDTDLGEVLAQARGFGVGLTLAHQHLGQLDNRMKAAVLANARTKVVFQTGADDASILAKQLGGSLAAADLMGLLAHQAYLAACVGGRVLPPASLRTEPLSDPAGNASAIRAVSQQRFGQDRDEVESAMAARQDPGVPTSVGRRTRTKGQGGRP
jgi:hypothetical protein